MNKLILIILFFLYALGNGYSQNIKINEICASNFRSFEDSYSEHGDWVEFYNAGSSSVNLGGMYITDNFSNLTKFQIPTNNPSATTIASHNHLVFWLDDETYKGPTHTNFKLANSGERIALVASNGSTIIDSISFSALSYDVTYGRTTDGSSSWSYFPSPTPDDDNSGGGYQGIAGKATFNLDAGFYSSSIQVELTAPDPQSVVYYSLNGNEPSPTRGILYTGPINITSTKVVRARVYKTNWVPGEVTTRSYFINRTRDLPILSVVTDSSNLWDEDDGIYCFGVDDYDHFYPYYGANFWEDWKKPAHIELFETSGAEVISQNLKLSLSGNTSRVYAQKSFNFEADDALGKNTISYQVFPQLQVTEFKSLKVRNGGSDWSSTGIRDAFNHTLLEGATDVDHQAYRPVILYLNGAYWGLIQLTEKLDEDYLNEHYPDIDKDSVDILYSNAEIEKGDANNYNAMISFITNNSLAQQANYNYIKSQMEIQEYINYFQTRIYYASTDWPNKNIKYWRPKDLSRKWRWIMWDTDRSDLLTTNPNHPCNVTHNTLAWTTTSSSVASWARFLLNNLLLNSEFKTQFITQFAHHMNFTFCPIRTDSVLNVFRSRLHNELPAHITRWEHSNDTIDYFTVGYYHSRSQWNVEVDTIKYFFDNRAKYIRKYMMQQFGIADTSRLTLVKVPPQGGSLVIDTFPVPSNNCNLVYFDGYPVSIRAVAAPGYVFTGWTTAGGNTMPITWNPNGDTTVTAYFSSSAPNQPTVASTNFSSSISNCTNVQLNWTSGNGSSRLVVARASAAVNAFPADQQSYTANSVFGSGSNLGNGNYVVYSGNGNSCTITGLSGGVTYHFAIIEFNGSSVTSDYNTSSYLTGNSTTSVFNVLVTSSANSFCSGSNATLSASGGVSYQWSPSTGLSSTTGATVTATPNSSITYTVVATNSNGCVSSNSISISVNPLPTVTLNNFANSCVSSTALTLSGGSPSGGTYSGTAVSGGVFNPSVAGVGTHTITYTYTNSNGCTNSASKTISVVANPVVTLNSFNDICLNASPVTLSGGSPAGGTYSGTGVSGGSFNPSTAGVGIKTITYSYTNSSGCSNTATSTITVNASPVVTLGAFNAVCVNAAPISLSGGSPAGGAYSGAGVSGGFFNPSAAGVGSKTITYSYTNSSGCTNTATSTITVNAIPVVTLSAFNDACINASPILLSGGSPAGGTYSGVGVSGGYFDPSVAGLGNKTITYTYTNSPGCSGTATSTLTVNALPVVTLGSFNNVCLNASPVTLSGGSPAGGTYSGPGVSGGSFNPSTAGVGIKTITYSYTNSSGCSNTATSTITVNAIPVVTLGAFNAVCVNAAPISLSGGSPAGGTYSGAGVSGGFFNPSAAGVGSKTITYSYTNSSGCTNTATSTITVNSIPVVTLGSFNDVCLNASPVLLSGGLPAGGTYSGVGVSGGYFDPSVAGLGSKTITYTYTNSPGCSGTATSTLTVNALPVVTLGSFNNVCLNASPVTLSGGSPAGGTYSGIGVSGGSFNPSTAGVGIKTITYSYTNSSGCSNTATSTITVNAIPVVTLGAFNAVCVNAAPISLSGGSPAGGTYSGAGVSGGFFDPATAGVGVKTITYSYTNSSGCTNTATSTITVNAIPVVTLNAFNDACINASPILLSGGSPAGGTYSGVGVSGGYFDPSVAGLGSKTITYTYTNSPGCSGTATSTLTVNALPVVTLGSFNNVCLNASPIVLSGGSPAGGTYSGAGVSGGSFNPSAVGVGVKTITYSYTNSSGCSNSATSTIIVDAIPLVSLSAFNDACINASPILLSGGTPAGGTYSGVGVSGGYFDPSTAGVGSKTITYTYTSSSGCTNTATSTITVNSIPVVTLGSFNDVCLNTSPVVLSGGLPAGGTYSGVGVSGGYFDPSVAGLGSNTITYTYTNSPGCSGTATSTLTVNALPVVTLGSFNNVCLNASPIVLSGGSPAGGTFSGPGVSGGSFNPSAVGVGVKTITYSYTNSSGCSNSATSTIIVDAIPVVSLSAFNDACINASPILLSGGTPAGGTYSGVGVSGGYFDPSTAGVGSKTITYTYTSGSGCINTATSTITVNSIPVVTLGSFNDVCLNASPVLLNGGLPAGGTYSGVGVSGGYFDPSMAGLGSSTITYTFTNSPGCDGTATSTITVNALPVVTLGSFSNVCQSASPFQLIGGLPAGGTYSGAGVSGGYFNPANAGTGSHSIIYNYNDVSGCGNSDTSFIQVIPSPNIFLGNDTIVCAYNSILLDAGSGLSTYLWSTGAGGQTILADSSGNGLGTVTYSVTVTDASGCIANDEIHVTYDVCANIAIEDEAESLFVYPNPFSESLTIITGENSFVVTMFDILGKVILRKTMHVSDPVIHPSVNAGVYFLEVYTSKGKRIVKLVKTD